MNRNDLCWCGSGRKYKKCHLAYDERLDAMKFDFFKGQVLPPRNIIKNTADIEGIRKAGILNDAALDLAASMVEEGRDTASIDDAVRKLIEGNGGIPACLNYEGYPKSVCTSINEVVCHGIPKVGDVLQEGDIVNVDYSELDAEGNVVENTERKGFTFTLGSGYNFYKLDKDFEGMSAGEEKKI